MSKKYILFTIIGFKLTWLSCVFGELYFNSWFGFFIGITYLIIFLLTINNRWRALKICLTISLVGYFFDSLLSKYNLYVLEADINFLYLPVWFLVLWPAFSTLFVYVFLFLEKNIFISILLSSMIGPLSYYTGISVGLANVANFYYCFSLMIFFWAILIFLYCKYIKKEKFIHLKA